MSILDGDDRRRVESETVSFAGIARRDGEMFPEPRAPRMGAPWSQSPSEVEPAFGGLGTTTPALKVEDIMKDESFTSTFTVDRTPEEAFAAINDVRAWWDGNIEGGTHAVGDEFTYRYKDLHYSKQRVTELVPGRRVVWQVLDSSLNFIANKSEWNGTKVTFEIARKGDKTEVRFTHVGLVPERECYDACSGGWGTYFDGSLRSLMESGKGQPGRSKKG